MSSNLLSVIDGKIQITNDAYGKVNTLTPFICRADKQIICALTGITKFDITLSLTDISEIQFSVTKYIINSSTKKQELNPAYKYLNSFYGVLIPEFGNYGYFRINEEPKIKAENTKNEIKSFTAYSGESVLQYENLVGFYVNQGTTSSLEMYEENTSSTGIPKQKIQLYNPDKPKLSLLDLIFTDDYYGWTIGHVDNSIKTIMRAFSVSNSKNIYSFLVNDVAQAFRCIFDFDTVHNVINVYKIEDYGNNTNIYLSFERFVQEINVKQNSDEIYTVFNVSGDNDLNISYVNFGSNKIVNLDYPLAMMDKDLFYTYKKYEVYRESLREEYKDLTIEYNYNLSLISSLNDRQPIDEINNNWSSTVYYTLNDLTTDLAMYQSAIELIEELYTDENGVLNLDDLKMSPDASLYYSYKSVIIPDITNEIKYRKGTIRKRKEKIDSDIIWDMYGLNDLITKKNAYLETIDALAEAGYNKPWSSSKTISEATWTEHYNQWRTYKGYVKELNALIDEKEEQIASIEQENNTIKSRLKELANSSTFEYYVENNEESIISDLTNIHSDDSDYTVDVSNYPEIVKSLYKESDYVDDNYLITESDDATSIVTEAEELYDAAVKRLYVESRPQLKWSIDTDSLYATKDFEKLRDSLQLGDFINLVFDTYRLPTRFNEEFIYMESGEDIFIEDGYDFLELENNTFIGENYRFRVSEIEFDGLDFTDFSITFTDIIQSRAGNSDIETIIDSFVSSRANQIKVDTSNSASSIASAIASSLIKPYLQVANAAIENAEITNARIEDLEVINANVETLLASYIKADELDAEIANINSLTSDSAIINNINSLLITADNANIVSLLANYIKTDELDAAVANINSLTADSAFVQNLETMIISADKATIFDLMAGNITSDKSITLVKDDSGSIIIDNSTMKYLDSDNNLRMLIGSDGEDGYDIKIYSAEKQDGTQDLLWDTSTGIQSGAIADNLISTNMIGNNAVTSSKINWSGISDGTDAITGKPIFNSGQVSLNGESLTTQWSNLQDEVADISITASSQVFTSTDGSDIYSPTYITLTPNAKLIPLTRLLWYYKTDSNVSWTQITDTISIGSHCYIDENKQLIILNDFSAFANNRSVVFKCAANNIVTGEEAYRDTITIMKISNGVDGETTINVIMSNEAQTIATDEDNYPFENYQFSTSVDVFMGTAKLTPVLPTATLTSGTFKISSVTCLDSGMTIDFSSTAGVVSYSVNKNSQIASNGYIRVNIEVFGLTDTVSKTIGYSSSLSGKDGTDAVLLRIDSSRGTVFKNNAVNTILSVIIYKGSERIENSTQLASVFGAGARLEWEWLRLDDATYGTISASDSRISDKGFHLTLSPQDVDVKVTFRCNLIEN